MLGKILCGSVVSLLLSSPSIAGFYIGAGIGPEYAQFTQKTHVLDNYGSFNVIDEQNFSGAGIFGTFFGGYSWTHNWFYLAGEANFNPSSLQYRLVNKEYIHKNFEKSSFTIHYSEGVSALPGVLLTKDAIVYGRIGYANGHVELHNSDPTIRSSKANRSGIRYGVGMRYNLSNQWALMADYSQTNYEKFHSRVYEPNGGVYKSSRTYPVSAQFAFGIIYNFEKPVVFVK
ncbi:outer membrane protein [Legionella rowbothamii]|uniref:outer membrane protein n=1 Tax=Legionella rowbothamii TaxID=96229 RepID=UPI0010544719|nr:outer membrane beta-barrel protein [Legionella rowbothamii]